MNLLIHLIKYNLKFHAIRVGFLVLTAVIIYVSGKVFSNDLKDLGQHLVQYSFYVLFFLIIGRLNTITNLMFGVKHLVGLPMSKAQIVIHKSISDIIFFVPASITFSLGLYYIVETIPFIFIWIGSIGAVVLANLIALNKRIDFSRMQHSKTSFKNTIVLFNKYLDSLFAVFITVMYVSIVYAIFKENPINLVWSCYVFLAIAIFFVYKQTLDMLSDESRSYFMVRRDIIPMGVKVVLFILPVIGATTLSRFIEKDDQELLSGVYSQVRDFMTLSEEDLKMPLLMSVYKKDYKRFEEVLKKDKDEIKWDHDIKGGYIIHWAAEAKDERFISSLLDIKPDEINRTSKNYHLTPLHIAIDICDMKVVELLIQRGADLNQADKKGSTPLMHAAQRGCFGAMFRLLDKKADVSKLDKDGKNYLDYLRKYSGMKEYIDSTYGQKRFPASIPQKKTKTNSEE